MREEQQRFEGFLADGGHLEIRCRMDLSPRSMAALWMVGFEDEPERCGEVCVVEIFGNQVRDGSAEVGMGLKKLRDPVLVHDFEAPRLTLDVADFHTYAVDWDAAAGGLQRGRHGGTPLRRARRRTRSRSWWRSSTSRSGPPVPTSTWSRR